MKPVKLLSCRKPSKAKSPNSSELEKRKKAESDKRNESGLWGEDIAVEFLKSKKYRIAGRRFRIGYDEIDIIAVPPDDSRKIVFIEVKTRRSSLFGGPLAAIGPLKRRALCRAAAHYLRKLPAPTPAFRFDAVTVLGSPETENPIVKHVENIFPMSLKYVVSFLHRRLNH